MYNCFLVIESDREKTSASCHTGPIVISRAQLELEAIAFRRLTNLKNFEIASRDSEARSLESSIMQIVRATPLIRVIALNAADTVT